MQKKERKKERSKWKRFDTSVYQIGACMHFVVRTQKPNYFRTMLSNPLLQRLFSVLIQYYVIINATDYL